MQAASARRRSGQKQNNSYSSTGVHGKDSGRQHASTKRPSHDSHFSPRGVERENATAGEDRYQVEPFLTEQEMAERLEAQRINELTRIQQRMPGKLLHKGRCPKCTLKPPCSHYESAAALPNDGGKSPPMRRLRTKVKPVENFQKATQEGEESSPERSPPSQRTYLDGIQEIERAHVSSVQRLAESRKYYSNFFKDNLKNGRLNYSLQGKLTDSEEEDDESVDPEEKNDAIEGEDKLRGKKTKLPHIKLASKRCRCLPRSE